jgi:hypothetical protein
LVSLENKKEELIILIAATSIAIIGDPQTSNPSILLVIWRVSALRAGLNMSIIPLIFLGIINSNLSYYQSKIFYSEFQKVI